MTNYINGILIFFQQNDSKRTVNATLVVLDVTVIECAFGHGSDGLIVDVGHQSFIASLVRFNPRRVRRVTRFKIKPERRIVGAFQDHPKKVLLARTVDKDGEAAVVVSHSVRL